MNSPATTQPRLSALAVKAASGLRRLERHSPRTERALLLAAVVVFVGSGWYAWQNMPDVETTTRWWLLVPAAGLALLTLAVNGAEFAVATRLLGRRIRAFGAFHISVLSSAANALPIPGAVVIKTRALRQQGQSYKHSFTMTASIGVLWVALAMIVTGALQAGAAQWALAGAFLAVGAAGWAFGMALLAGAVGRRKAPRASLPIMAVELVSVAVATLRLHVLLLAMGFDTAFYQSAALATAGIVASAVGIFPGGLGLRELLSAGTASLTGLDPSVGLLVSVLDRVVSFGVAGLASLILLGTRAADLAADTTELPGRDREEPQPTEPTTHSEVP